MNRSIVFPILISVLSLSSCNQVIRERNSTIPPVENNIEKTTIEMIESPEIQYLIDSAKLKGSVLILKNNTFYSNNYTWAKTGHLPASTFKIPNSIFALETGIIQDDSTIIKWDGEPRQQKRWEQDLSFKQAFHFSCVPCYREIARNIGESKMKNLIDTLNYGNIQFDSTSLDMFWLQGPSKINQFQQIEFLKAFHEEKLPVSQRTYAIMKRMMIIESDSTSTLRGKTGWSVTNEIDNCWFVGYIESAEGMTYFATNIEPKSGTNINDIVDKRKDVTLKALELIK